MDKSYPSFQPSYSPEELVEHFLLAEKSLAIYRDLALTDVATDDEAAMRTFPIR